MNIYRCCLNMFWCFFCSMISCRFVYRVCSFIPFLVFRFLVVGYLLHLLVHCFFLYVLALSGIFWYCFVFLASFVFCQVFYVSICTFVLVCVHMFSYFVVFVVTIVFIVFSSLFNVSYVLYLHIFQEFPTYFDVFYDSLTCSNVFNISQDFLIFSSIDQCSSIVFNFVQSVPLWFIALQIYYLTSFPRVSLYFGKAIWICMYVYIHIYNVWIQAGLFMSIRHGSPAPAT